MQMERKVSFTQGSEDHRGFLFCCFPLKQSTLLVRPQKCVPPCHVRFIKNKTKNQGEVIEVSKGRVERREKNNKTKGYIGMHITQSFSPSSPFHTHPFTNKTQRKNTFPVLFSRSAISILWSFRELLLSTEGAVVFWQLQIKECTSSRD